MQFLHNSAIQVNGRYLLSLVPEFTADHDSGIAV
jgi:hypothetical protein